MIIEFIVETHAHHFKVAELHDGLIMGVVHPPRQGGFFTSSTGAAMHIDSIGLLCRVLPHTDIPEGRRYLMEGY